MGTIQADYLRGLILELSRGRRVQDIVSIVRSGARKLTKAEGATFILKDNDKCYYVDEDAVGPLWKGKKFPIETCISGWAMMNKSSAIIKDIYKDPRIPIDTYRPTFVKSLVMVPINAASPFGAIGNYWSSEHQCTDDELRVLTLLAEITSIALQNVEMLDQLENSLNSNQKHYKAKDELMTIVSDELNTFRGSGAIYNKLEEFSQLISELDDMKTTEAQLKKIIFEISLKQLHEMNHLLGEYLEVRVL